MCIIRICVLFTVTVNSARQIQSEDKKITYLFHSDTGNHFQPPNLTKRMEWNEGVVSSKFPWCSPGKWAQTGGDLIEGTMVEKILRGHENVFLTINHGPLSYRI